MKRGYSADARWSKLAPKSQMRSRTLAVKLRTRSHRNFAHTHTENGAVFTGSVLGSYAPRAKFHCERARAYLNLRLHLHRSLRCTCAGSHRNFAHACTETSRTLTKLCCESFTGCGAHAASWYGILRRWRAAPMVPVALGGALHPTYACKWDAHAQSQCMCTSILHVDGATLWICPVRPPGFRLRLVL